MDHVESEEQGDVQPALFDREMLHPIHLCRIGQPQDRPNTTVRDVAVGGGGDEASQADARRKVELPDLFLECHSPEEGLGAS